MLRKKAHYRRGFFLYLGRVCVLNGNINYVEGEVQYVMLYFPYCERKSHSLGNSFKHCLFNSKEGYIGHL